VGQQTTAELPVGSEFAGYRIEEVAARGGMGVVYRATQLRLTRAVALKLVTPALARDASFRERFRREWMIAASIDHPNVIPVYEAGEEDGALFIAMRWVEGSDLRDEIDRGPLEPAHAARIVSQVASALDAAHARDLIHRDIKPANILLTGSDHVYLTDFGLTKHASSISGLTRTGQWVGTVEYTAPEQIQGAPVSLRADVYALGCILFEALTGQAPFKRDNDLATLWAHVYTSPPSLQEISPDLPASFEGIVQRAIAKDPEERYASAGELGRAISAAALAPAVEAEAPIREKIDAPSGARPTSPGRGPRIPWLSRRRALLGVVGFLLLIAAVAAIAVLPGSDESEPDRAALTPSPPLRAASAWRRLPPMPTARQNMVSTVLDGTVWVVGGLAAGSTPSQRIEGYDPVIHDWKAGPDLPLRLHHEMAVTYKGELVVIGGWIPKGSDPSAVVSDRVFALRDGRWVELPSLGRARAAGAAAVVGDQIVVMGGQSDDRLVATTEVFDGKRWTKGEDIPTPREHMAAASDGQFVYALGGRALSPDKNSRALERFDPAKNRWQTLPDMPTARGGLGAAIVDGHLLAVGGESATGVFGEVESYDLGSRKWSSAPSMGTPRHGIAVAAIGRSLYALGGAPKPGHASATATAEVLSLRR
jgi:N-acetylneuraminic acid mutarotase